MKRLVLLGAVLAMVLSPVVAWGDVAVLAGFEPGDALPGVTDWTVVGLNTDDTAGSGSLASLEVTAVGATGYISVSVDPVVDATDMPYINFYVNTEGATTVESGAMYPFGGGGYSDYESFPEFDDVGPGAGWTYVSVNRSAMSDQGIDWSVVDGLELGGSLAGTILFDHITVSTTPEEGMLGAGQPEVECDAVICDFEAEDGCGDWYGGTAVADTWDASSSFAWQLDGEDGWGDNPAVAMGDYGSVGFWLKYTGDVTGLGGYFYNEAGGDEGGDFTLDDQLPAADTWEYITISLDAADWDSWWGAGPPVMVWGAAGDGDVAIVLSYTGTGTVIYDDICVFGEPPEQYAGSPEASGAPVAGMLGLGLVAAACALGGAMTLRKK